MAYLKVCEMEGHHLLKGPPLLEGRGPRELFTTEDLGWLGTEEMGVGRPLLPGELQPGWDSSWPKQALSARPRGHLLQLVSTCQPPRNHPPAQPSSHLL